MGSGDAYDVFLSYAHSDGAAAADLNGWLSAQGLSTFLVEVARDVNPAPADGAGVGSTGIVKTCERIRRDSTGTA